MLLWSFFVVIYFNLGVFSFSIRDDINAKPKTVGSTYHKMGKDTTWQKIYGFGK